MSHARTEKLSIGIDLGGTKIEGVVFDEEFREVTRLRAQTRPDEGYPHVLERIVRLYESLGQSVGNATHTLGICTPGSISSKTGLLKNCNATELNGHPLLADLQQRLNRPLALENDANCFALAEAKSGAAVNVDVVLGIVLGTGVGAGIVVHGKLLTGRHGIAGEWGHTSVNPNGPPCYCGRRGCAERYISGRALQERYRERTGAAATVEGIVARARQGDTHASALLDDFLTDFAGAVANVIAVLDPQVIVIGGGLASIDELYDEAVLRLSRIVFNDSFDTPVLRNVLGNSAGVVGAALIGV